MNKYVNVYIILIILVKILSISVNKVILPQQISRNTNLTQGLDKMVRILGLISGWRETCFWTGKPHRVLQISYTGQLLVCLGGWLVSALTKKYRILWAKWLHLYS